MFNRAIIATDLSSASYAVVHSLGGLKTLGVKQVLLLQCLSIQEVASVALSYTTAYLQGVLRQDKEVLERQGFKVETRVLPGFAKREINQVAAAEDFPLIVIGSATHSMVGEAILGGLASEMIHNARKPILLVHVNAGSAGAAEAQASVPRDFSEHILFPTDFSANADHAFKYVRGLVAEGARKVTLLHVQDRSRMDPHLMHRLEEFNEIDRGRLEKMRAALGQAGGAEVRTELCFGSPFTEIMRVLGERDVRLVVLGSQGRGFVEELFLGSVSHNVARHSTAPVLLIPAERVGQGA